MSSYLNTHASSRFSIHHHTEHKVNYADAVESALRLLAHNNILSKKFLKLRRVLEDHCIAMLSSERKRDTKLSFVKLLGAREPVNCFSTSTHHGDDELDVGFVDAGLSGEQREEQERIDFFERWELPRMAALLAVQVYLFLAVTLRYAFQFERGDSSRGIFWQLIVEDVFVDGFLLLNFIITYFFEPVVVKGLTRFPPVGFCRRILSVFFDIPICCCAQHDEQEGDSGDEERRRYYQHPFTFASATPHAHHHPLVAWLALLGLVPLEAIIAVLSGSLGVEGLAPVSAGQWQANRLLHCLYVSGTVQRIIDHRHFVNRVDVEVARIVMTFLRLLSLSHLFACAAIRWLPQGMPALVSKKNITDPFFVYIVKYDCSFKLMTAQDCGNVVGGEDLFSFLVGWAIVLSGVLFSALVIAVVSNYVEKSTASVYLSLALDAMHDVSTHTRLPDDLRQKCLAYIVHSHVIKTQMQPPTALFKKGVLPEPLLRRILYHQGRAVLRHVPMFAAFLREPNVVISVAESLQPQLLGPFQVLFRRGDRSHAVYFVVEGALRVLVHAHAFREGDSSSVFSQDDFVLGQGSVLGEVSVIGNCPRTATVVGGAVFSHLLALPATAMQSLQTRFPGIFAVLRHAAKQRYITMLHEELAFATTTTTRGGAPSAFPGSNADDGTSLASTAKIPASAVFGLEVSSVYNADFCTSALDSRAVVSSSRSASEVKKKPIREE